MRFKSYITENRSKKVDLDFAIKMAKTKCSKSVDTFLKTGHVLYRGIQSKDIGEKTPFRGEYLTIDPKKFTRGSAYVGHNYYTLMIDNLRQWKDYPKRSKSIVCATGRSKASEYIENDNLYYVFPVNGSSIGIASADDMFYSFKHIDSMRGFSNACYRDDLDDSSWDALVSSAKEWDENYKTVVDFEERSYLLDIGYISDNYNGNILATLANMLDPKMNKFEVKKAGVTFPVEREAWTDGECILVNYKSIDEFTAKLMEK